MPENNYFINKFFIYLSQLKAFNDRGFSSITYNEFAYYSLKSNKINTAKYSKAVISLMFYLYLGQKVGLRVNKKKN